MDTERFNRITDHTFLRCLELLAIKGHEYAYEEPNRLEAFYTAGALQGISPVEALGGMMAKHTVSIYDMIQKNDKYTMSDWNEKIIDHINYLALLRALVFEELEGRVHLETSEDPITTPVTEPISRAQMFPFPGQKEEESE